MTQYEALSGAVLIGFLIRTVVSGAFSGLLFHVASRQICKGRSWVPSVGMAMLWCLGLSATLSAIDWTAAVLLGEASARAQLILGLVLLLVHFPINWGWFHLALRHATPRQSLLVTLMVYGLMVGAIVIVGLFGWLVIGLTWR